MMYVRGIFVPQNNSCNATQRRTKVRKQLLIALALLTFICPGLRTASAQSTGGVKGMKPKKPKTTPAPTGATQPAPPGETQPSARPRPGTPAAQSPPDSAK